MRVKTLMSPLVVLSVLGLCACGPSPEQLCRDQATVDCERMWTCNSSVKVGSDVGTCKTQMDALCGLALGSKVDASKAEKCTAEKKAQTCEQYNAGEPASCK